MKNRNEIDEIVFGFWNDYLGFQTLPNEGEVKVMNHMPCSNLPEKELYEYHQIGKGILISIHDKYKEKVQELINSKGYNTLILRNSFEEITGKNTKLLGPIMTSYLYDTGKLLKKNDNIKTITLAEKRIYDDFLLDCTYSETDEVDMNILDPTHKFFVYQKEGKTVSMGNYSVDDKLRIGHIGIITPAKYSGNGYGKEVVNTIVHDILENNLIPQYRVSITNTASRKIAESLGFKEYLDSYSFVTI